MVENHQEFPLALCRQRHLVQVESVNLVVFVTHAKNLQGGSFETVELDCK